MVYRAVNCVPAVHVIMSTNFIEDFLHLQVNCKRTCDHVLYMLNSVVTRVVCTVGNTRITLHDFIFGDEFLFTVHFLVSIKIIIFLHYTFRLLSCKHEPLTRGNRLNPNHNGSSTERDVPKQRSHVKV